MANPLDQFFGSNSGLGSGKGGIQIGDVANTVGGLAGNFFKDFGPLQGQLGDIYQQVLGGNAPQAILPLLAGQYGQIAQGQEQATQQVEDKLSGAARSKALMGINEAGVGAKANSFQDILKMLLSGATGMGANVTAQTQNPLLAIGGLRAQEKQANNAGGGGSGISG
jgi:hypothetical protein